MAKLCKKSSMITYLAFLLGVLMVPELAFSKAPAWYSKMKDITLFRSKKTDVERLFKFSSFKQSSKDKGLQSVYYDIDGGTLTLTYSSGPCSRFPSSVGYDVDEDVVVRISAYSFKAFPLSDFDFDLSQFESYREKDNNATIWSNDEIGVQVTGGSTPKGKKLVTGVEFYPTVQQKQELSCNK